MKIKLGELAFTSEHQLYSDSRQERKGFESFLFMTVTHTSFNIRGRQLRPYGQARRIGRQ